MTGPRRSVRLAVVSGWTSTGKTLFAHRLAEAVRPRTAVVVSQDDYYRDTSHLSREERTAVNYDEPGSYDLALLASGLGALGDGGTAPRFAYDFTTGARTEVGVVGPAEVVIVEGFLVLWDPAIREAADLSIFLDGDPGRLLERRIRRDGRERAYSPEEVRRRFEDMVIPAQRRYLADAPRTADLVFSMDWGEAEVAEAAAALCPPGPSSAGAQARSDLS